MRAAGLSQRFVWALFRSLELRIERPRVERSLEDEYIPPALGTVSKVKRFQENLLTESRPPTVQPIVYLSMHQE